MLGKAAGIRYRERGTGVAGGDGLNEGLRHGVYGTPPDALCAVAPEAIQFSPLLPGSNALEAQAPGSLASLAMLAPPGTIERRYAIALGLRALAPGAPFTILAPKDRGGARLAAELEAFGCEVHDEARRHHRICTGLRPAHPVGLDDALSEGAPRFIEALGLWSQPGVFSWDRIDPGSALLIQHLPALSGRGADFGGGTGVLSQAVLASPKVTKLSLYEIDRRAIEAAKRNIGDARIDLRWADLRQPNATLAKLDFVVMNPPFHDGGAEDKTLGQSFIRRAAESLRNGGQLWLTANRHLPYEAVLKPLFKQVTVVAEASGYKIFEARK
jgi:16S rRNA (guanine1207-N2)-methyltransferase